MTEGNNQAAIFPSIEELMAKDLDFKHGNSNVSVHATNNRRSVEVPTGFCGFGVTVGKNCSVHDSEGKILLPENYYFRLGPGVKIRGKSALVVLVAMPPRETKFGKIPQRGAIEYEPGGQETTLVYPDIFGEPTLNFLSMEPHFRDQLMHWHDAIRINIVISGEVFCETPSHAPVTCNRGSIIILPNGALHRFRTNSTGMKFVAFHPDSEFGPTPKNNPMFNKTRYT